MGTDALVEAVKRRVAERVSWRMNLGKSHGELSGLPSRSIGKRAFGMLVCAASVPYLGWSYSTDVNLEMTSVGKCKIRRNPLRAESVRDKTIHRVFLVCAANACHRRPRMQTGGLNFESDGERPRKSNVTFGSVSGRFCLADWPDSFLFLSASVW